MRTRILFGMATFAIVGLFWGNGRLQGQQCDEVVPWDPEPATVSADVTNAYLIGGSAKLTFTLTAQEASPAACEPSRTITWVQRSGPVYVTFDSQGRDEVEATFSSIGTYRIGANVDYCCADPSRLSTADVLVHILENDLQLPSDITQDGDLDISDGISLATYLFLGYPDHLPCGNQAVDDPANVRLLDATGDGKLDIADVIHVFDFLFMGDSPPALGRTCTPIHGCPRACYD